MRVGKFKDTVARVPARRRHFNHFQTFSSDRRAAAAPLGADGDDGNDGLAACSNHALSSGVLAEYGARAGDAPRFNGEPALLAAGEDEYAAAP